jgi:hypothetical protein
MVPREKWGHGNYHWKPNNKKERVWINNQLSEIPNEDKVMILIKISYTTRIK